MSGFQRYGDLLVWIFMIILCWLLRGATLDYTCLTSCLHGENVAITKIHLVRCQNVPWWIEFHTVAEFFLCLNVVFNPLSYGLFHPRVSTTVWKITIWLIDSWFFLTNMKYSKKKTHTSKRSAHFGSWSYKILFRFRLNDALQMWVHAVAFMPQRQPKPWFQHQMSRSLGSVKIWNCMLGKGKRETLHFLRIFAFKCVVFSNGSLKKRGWNNWSARNPGTYTPWN